MEITFLGTGTSHGIPIIGCKCPTCRSNDTRNKRSRCSVYISIKNQKLLIDTPPELRLQLLQNNIAEVSAVLFTHPHADHLMGFDDIRGLNRVQGQSIPCYGNRYLLEEIKTVFHYIFDAPQQGGGLPRVDLKQITGVFQIGEVTITPLPVKHGQLDILGYRIGDMAYITDCSQIPGSTMDLLKGLKLLIIDALRYREHPTHMNVEQALEVIKQLQVDRAYLTHISHNLEHKQLKRELPAGVQPAYDGLTIEL